jgi:hypothetical protein
MLNSTILTAPNPKQIVWCDACDYFVGFLKDILAVMSLTNPDKLLCPECNAPILSSIKKDIRWAPPRQQDLPKRWILIKRTEGFPLYGLYQFNNNLATVASIDFVGHTQIWLHISASYKNCIPSYEDLCCVKKIFIGDDNDAYHAFPRKSRHVNFHPYTLHLWHRLDGPTMPDFRVSENMI